MLHTRYLVRCSFNNFRQLIQSVRFARKTVNGIAYPLYGPRIIQDSTRNSFKYPLLGIEKESKRKQTQFLTELLYKHFNLSIIDNDTVWTSFEAEAIETIQGIRSNNVDALIMSHLRSCQLYDKGESFLKYLKNKDRSPNAIVMANYMILAAECGEEAKALEVYEKLDKALFIVPSMTHLVIQGLICTSKWKECLPLLRQLTELHIPSIMEIACKAFQVGELALGEELVNQIINSNCEPKNAAYTKWLDTIILMEKEYDICHWLTTKLLESLRKTEHMLSITNAHLLKRIFLRSVSRIKSAVTNENGVCSECQYRLEEPILTDEEYDKLREAFHKHIVKGSLTYMASNPDELGHYFRFIDRAKPFDIVLDGLNVAYYGRHSKKPGELAQQLFNVVVELKNLGYTPVILGRKHIWRWNTQIMSRVESLAKCFYADNISSDDPFFLYTALHGGPRTLFMTHDLLRDHHYLLDEEYKPLFRKWVYANQVFYDSVLDNFAVLHHQKFAVCVQGNWSDGWHVPFEKVGLYKPHVPFRKQKVNWICAR